MGELKVGLDGVVAAETALSDVDGALGRLVIAGVSVEVARSFEAVAAALWSAAGLDGGAMASRLGAARAEAFARVAGHHAWTLPDGMDALRAWLASFPARGDLADDAVRMTAATAVGVAAWRRTRAGLALIAPDERAPHVADLLRTTLGHAEPARVAALDRYLATVVDHGMNASTFAARVVASTGSDTVSAVVAAIGALKGPLHGGAPGPVLDMLDAIGDPADARAWLTAELGAGRRIMGMGHRVYRARDPRAAVLEQALSELQAAVGSSDRSAQRLAAARAVEHEATALLAARHPDRPLRANVEFFTAVLLEAIGVPRALFTPMFAASRVVGWTAHVVEQQRTGRLMRPSSRYVGRAA